MSFNSLGKYGATWFIVNVKKKSVKSYSLGTRYLKGYNFKKNEAVIHNLYIAYKRNSCVI